MTASFRDLPAVDEILRWESLHDTLQDVGHAQLSLWVRAAVNACRAQLKNGCELSKEGLVEFIYEQIQLAQRQDDGLRMQSVVNATGVLLHTNLGRAPLALAAAERVQACTQYTNLEMDFSTGKRNHRGERVCKLLARLTGAEDAIVVNNCAAATMLVLGGVAAGKEVIVSRGQLVEIGGGFRLPEVFASAGVILREVGTTNRTYLKDYQSACSDETGAIIRVSRSNFVLQGFTAEPTIGELAGLERPSTTPVIDDAGSGCVVELGGLGIDEPTVQASITAGADLCLFSGDKLFGGPQAGIVVGKQQWLAKLRRHPMMRAMRLDKLTLAALEATTEIHLAGEAFEHIPFYRMLAKTKERIREQCESLAASLRGRLDQAVVEVVECDAQVGGGSLPAVTLPSYGVRVSHVPVTKLAATLRAGNPPVLCRLTDDGLLFDLRTVTDAQLAELPALLETAVA